MLLRNRNSIECKFGHMDSDIHFIAWGMLSNEVEYLLVCWIYEVLIRETLKSEGGALSALISETSSEDCLFGNMEIHPRLLSLLDEVVSSHPRTSMVANCDMRSDRLLSNQRKPFLHLWPNP